MTHNEIPSQFGGFVRGRELGRGASGTVFACEKGGFQHAVKTIDLRRLRLSAKADREFKKLRREVDILKRVPPHPNLVQFIDSFEDDSWFFLVLEFVGGGDLFSSLVRRQPLPGRRPCFREPEAVYAFQQLVEGLGFLHKHDVIHRDLKLENVLVVLESKRGAHMLCDIKITDFGLSKVVGDGMSAAHSTVGSPKYIAPEVVARGLHDFRADLWSLGVLTFVLIAGRFPVDGPAEVAQSLIDSTVGSLDTSAPARSVILGLLQVQRENRTSFAALRDHEWFREQAPPAQPPTKKNRNPEDMWLSTDLEDPISLFGSEDVGGTEVKDEVFVETVSTAKKQEIITIGIDVAKEVINLIPNGEVDCGKNAAPRGLDTMLPPPPKVARSQPLSPALPLEESSGGVCQGLATVKELDNTCEGRFVRATIAFRHDHKSGGGFHLRLQDSTGEIDLRFWDEAASKFKSDPNLQKGAVLRIGGFRIVPLKPKDLPFAPPGRLHGLSFNRSDIVRLTVETAPPKKPGELPVETDPPERMDDQQHPFENLTNGRRNGTPG